MNKKNRQLQSLSAQFLNILSASGENVHHFLNNNTENLIHFAKHQQIFS